MDKKGKIFLLVWAFATFIVICAALSPNRNLNSDSINKYVPRNGIKSVSIVDGDSVLVIFVDGKKAQKFSDKDYQIWLKKRKKTFRGQNLE
ncbi:hypothetical protein K9M48_00860 [Candidatus Gracilibacteria bacterium]|nr:hypothetical protein [Candidatus Gracilibacteria bacterium]